MPAIAETSTSAKIATDMTCTAMRTGPSTTLPKISAERATNGCRELRRLPQGAERDERDDQHEGAAPEEQPRGNGEVLDPPDPVGEDVREELPIRA